MWHSVLPPATKHSARSREPHRTLHSSKCEIVVVFMFILLPDRVLPPMIRSVFEAKEVFLEVAIDLAEIRLPAWRTLDGRPKDRCVRRQVHRFCPGVSLSSFAAAPVSPFAWLLDWWARAPRSTSHACILGRAATATTAAASCTSFWWLDTLWC